MMKAEEPDPPTNPTDPQGSTPLNLSLTLPGLPSYQASDLLPFAAPTPPDSYEPLRTPLKLQRPWAAPELNLDPAPEALEDHPSPNRPMAASPQPMSPATPVTPSPTPSPDRSSESPPKPKRKRAREPKYTRPRKNYGKKTRESRRITKQAAAQYAIHPPGCFAIFGLHLTGHCELVNPPKKSFFD